MHMYRNFPLSDACVVYGQIYKVTMSKWAISAAGFENPSIQFKNFAFKLIAWTIISMKMWQLYSYAIHLTSASAYACMGVMPPSSIHLYIVAWNGTWISQDIAGNKEPHTHTLLLPTVAKKSVLPGHQLNWTPNRGNPCSSCNGHLSTQQLIWLSIPSLESGTWM